MRDAPRLPCGPQIPDPSTAALCSVLLGAERSWQREKRARRAKRQIAINDENDGSLMGDNRGFKTYAGPEGPLVLGARARIAICRLLREKLLASCPWSELVSSNSQRQAKNP